MKNDIKFEEFENFGFIWDLEVFSYQPEKSDVLQNYLPEEIFLPLTFAYSIKNLISFNQNTKKYSQHEINEDFKFIKKIYKKINLRCIFLENEIIPKYLDSFNKEFLIKNYFFTQKINLIFKKLIYAYKNNLFISKKDSIIFLSKTLNCFNILNNPFTFYSLEEYTLNKSHNIDEYHFKKKYYEIYSVFEKHFIKILPKNFENDFCLAENNKSNELIKNDFIVQLYEKNFSGKEKLKFTHQEDVFIEYLELIINSEYFIFTKSIEDYIKLAKYIDYYLKNEFLNSKIYKQISFDIKNLKEKILAINENNDYYKKLSNLLIMNIKAICMGWNIFELLELDLNKNIMETYNSKKLEKKMLLMYETFWKLYREYLYFGTIIKHNKIDSKYLEEPEKLINEGYDLFQSVKYEFQV